LLAQVEPELLDPFRAQRDQRDQLRALIGDLLAHWSPQTQFGSERIETLLAELVGLGPLDPLLSDPGISDILVNSPDEVWVERRGRLERVATAFRGPEHLSALMEKIAALVGRTLSLQTPCLDARMADGSRANLVIAPVGGPCLSIRRHRQELRALFGDAGSWVAGGGMSRLMGELFARAMRARCNFLVAGSTGAGKSTLLASLLAHVPANERLVVIEDTQELPIGPDAHAVRLQCVHDIRGASSGQRRVNLADLVVNALRMRPDRLVVGEIRTPREAYVTVEALNTGHPGSGSTIHADSAVDALGRLEMLIRREHGGFSAADVRAPIARAIDFIVHVTRQENGRRIVREVIELAGMRGPEYDLRPAFSWTADKGFEPRADYRSGPRVNERFRALARRTA
jgi:pilus assembly protein CpaF